MGACPCGQLCHPHLNLGSLPKYISCRNQYVQSVIDRSLLLCVVSCFS